MNPHTVVNTKRTSGQAALDNPPLGAAPNGVKQGRPIKPLPKRKKRQSIAIMPVIDDEPPDVLSSKR